MMIGARDYCISINYQYYCDIDIQFMLTSLFYRCVKNGVIPRKKTCYINVTVHIPRISMTSLGSYLTWVVYSHMCHGQKMDETTVLGVINLLISI